MCNFVDSGFDCADFRMLSILRILHAHTDSLSKELENKIINTVLSFKYWIDEPGEDSMCYWSENHQIKFHTCEYLAEQYCEKVFWSVNQHVYTCSFSSG